MTDSRGTGHADESPPASSSRLRSHCVTGIVFGVWPQLDIELAALFYDPATRSFSAYNSDWVIHARDAATLLISVLAAPAFFRRLSASSVAAGAGAC